MRRPSARALTPALACGGVILLVLATPFVHFLRYHSYPLARMEVAICLLGLAAAAAVVGAVVARSPIARTVALAGCLTFFADVQFHPPRGMLGLAIVFLVTGSVLWLLREHALRILGLTMATVLLSSVLLPVSGHASAAPSAAANGTRGNGPFVLHIVLDEQVGVEGLPADLAPGGFVERVKAFFIRNGFLLFGRTYSEYSYTHRAISHMVNFAAGAYVDGLDAFAGDDTRWVIRKNAYFEHFKARGYAIRVYQPDYLSYCGGSVKPTRCSTYYATSLQSLPKLPGPPADRALVIAGMYLDGSNAYAFVRSNYVKLRRRLPATRALLPPWRWERNRVSPLYGAEVLEAVRRDVARSHAGELVYAHILLPHYPYVYDESCRPRPPRAWQDRLERDNVPPRHINTPATRASKYALYFAQMECTMRRLQDVLDAIPVELKREAVVIVQGDHGSRISLAEPRRRESPMTRADYLDSFSALFAVRAPALTPGYDRRVVSIQCLFGELVKSGFASPPAADACSRSRVVFLAENEIAPTFPMPFRAFDDEPMRNAADTTAISPAQVH